MTISRLLAERARALTWADTGDRVQDNRAAYFAATAPSVMRSSACAMPASASSAPSKL